MTPLLLAMMRSGAVEPAATWNIPQAIQGQWVWPNISAAGANIIVGTAGEGGEFRVSRFTSGGVLTSAVPRAHETDDHNVPAPITCLSGKLLGAMSRHRVNNEVYVVRSASANDIDFGAVTVLTASTLVTYMELFRATGASRVWMLYRIGTSDLGSWAIRYSDDEGDTWSSEVTLCENTYMMGVLAPDGQTLRCFAYDHPIGGSDHDLYHFLVDLVGGNVTDSAGTVYGSITAGTGLPITKAEQRKILDVSGTTTTRMYMAGGFATPALFASEFIEGSAGNYYRYVSAGTTGAFTRELICGSGLPFFLSTSSYYGGVCPGASNDEVYASRNLGSQPGVGDWELAQWTRGGGGTWTKGTVIRRTTSILARPQVAAGRLWWSEMTSYPQFTSFKSRVRSVALA